MKPGARLQSAIELVDQIILAARDGGGSADSIAQRFFAERRYAGSKDRRAVRDLAWSAIRRFGERPDDARSAFVAMADHDPELAALFDGSNYGAPAIEPSEPRASSGLLPQWLSMDRAYARSVGPFLYDAVWCLYNLRHCANSNIFFSDAVVSPGIRQAAWRLFICRR